MKGLVIRAVSGDFTVECANKVQYVCKPRGNMSYNEDTIKVGDYVEFDESQKVISKVYKRINTLIRPLISNVDKVFVATSVKEPELNLYLLDKMLASFAKQQIPCYILFTKIDLLNEDELKKAQTLKIYYDKIGYTTYFTSQYQYDKQIESEIKDSICVLTGQTGVGKSSLMNQFDKKLNLKTDEISISLGRGKHTTRHIELYKIFGGYVADSPGFGNIDLGDLETVYLSELFVEFVNNRNECKFNNCTHTNEPKCKIKEMVNKNEILKSRYDNYLKFIEEIKDIKKIYKK